MESLTETTQKITQLVDDIKIAINNKGGNIGECTPLSDYANEIENLPVQIEEVYSGTFMVFKESEVTPDSPEGGRWTGSEFEYPEGWSPKQQSQRTYSNTSTNTWMSYAIITKDSDETITWSVPIKISGENGLSDRIGVKNYNENLYWTINDEYVLDTFGNKIKVSGNDGKDAPLSFTSFVFTRYASEPNIPTGGSYSNPVPDNTDFIWTSNIPSGNDLIWISSRIFTSDGNYPQQSEWTHPTQLSDTVDLDIEYSEIENPYPPEGHPNTNIEWSNNSSDLSIWMAISKKNGSEWSDWKISKIKGNSGDKAPIIYSAGIWESGKSYDATPDKIPYVYFTGTESYWLLDQSVGENYTSTLDPEEDSNWKPFNSFEAIYSDIGVFKQALVGKWVFHEDYMFSQDGIYTDARDSDYGQSVNYIYVLNKDVGKLAQLIEGGSWTPNICFNAKTGDGWLAGKSISWKNSEISIGEKLEDSITKITSNTLQTTKVVAENMIAKKVKTNAVNEPGAFEPTYNVEDHVEIEGNYVRIRTFENEDVVTISSDEVQNYFSPDAFKVTSDINGSEDYVSVGFMQQGNGKYYNKSSINQSALSLGFIDTNGYANVRIQIRLIQPGIGPVDTQYYTLNPTASFASQSRLQILKYDPVSNTYNIHSEKNITGWVNTKVPWGFDTSEAYTFWSNTIKVEPMNRGIYRIKLILPDNCIEGTNMGTGTYQFRIWYSITDVNRGTGSFSVVGKNGISLMSENCNIFMNDDKIEFTAGDLRENPDSPTLYGIRITPNGFQICNGGSTWSDWTP